MKRCFRVYILILLSAMFIVAGYLLSLRIGEILAFSPIFIVLAFSAFFSRDVFSVQPYLLLVVPYMALNLGFIYAAGVQVGKLPALVFTGMLAFCLSYLVVRSFSVDRFVVGVNKTYCMKLLFWSVVLLMLLKLWFHGGAAISLAIVLNLTVRPALEFILSGALFVAFGFFGFLRLLGVIVLVLAYLILGAFISDDVSRMSFFQFGVLAGVALVCRCKGFQYFQFGYLSMLLMLMFAFGVGVWVVLSGVTSGGDSFLYLNAIEVINEVDRLEKYEVLMPFHNALMILIPEFLWLDIKLKGYSTSGWYISNIMGMSPNEYPWGVGVTSFGAGYLYGGIFGVVLLFVFYGVLAGVFRNVARNPFMLGVLICFHLKLIYSMFRMDETMLIGAAIPSLLILCVSYFLFVKRVV